MSFGFQEIKSDCIKKIAVTEVVVETFVSDAESGGASKILSVLADSKIMSIEAMADEARISGRVNFKLVYLDNEGALRGLDYFADFTENVVIEGLSGKLYGKIAVIDTDTSLNGGIKLSSALEITLFTVKENEANCLVSADEVYYVEKGFVDTQNFVCTINSSFEVVDEYDTRADISKILLFDSSSYISDINMGMGNVLVNGGMVANVTYLTNEEVKTVSFNIPFSEEIEKPELIIGQLSTAESFIKAGRIVLTGVEGSNIIKVDGEIEIKLNVYAPSKCEIVTDIFSIEKELIEEKNCFVSEELCGTKYFTEKIAGVVSLGSDMPAVREIISVLAARNTVAQALSGDNNLVIEGIVNANVLYRDENGFNSAQVEIPYSLPFNAENLTNENTILATGIVLNSGAKAKRDREIEVIGDISFKVEIFCTKKSSYISQITEGEEKDINKSAVSVYIAEEGETFWDAAKALSARPDVLKEQNPELTIPLKAGDKIIYYRQINFQF